MKRETLARANQMRGQGIRLGFFKGVKSGSRSTATRSHHYCGAETSNRLESSTSARARSSRFVIREPLLSSEVVTLS